MKTETLIELQRSITQGEWFKLERYTNSNAIPIARKREDNAFSIFAECNGLGGVTGQTEGDANATAIALVPELIAEVIRLRGALGSIATIAAPCMSQEAECGFGYHSAEDKHRVDLNKLIILARESARAALVNDK